MKKTPKGLSIVIPAHNERKGIGGVLTTLNKTLKTIKLRYEIIIVDDGSTDGTAKVAKRHQQTRVISHKKKMGYGRSLSDAIAESKYSLIAIMDADGTYPIESLPDLIAESKKNDMVIGWRKKIRLPNAVLPKSFSRKILHFFATYLTGRKIVDLNSGFRVFKKELWTQHKTEFPSGFSFTTTLTLLSHFTRKKVRYVPIEYRPRIGTTKVHYFLDGMKVAWWMTLLTLRHKPARVVLPFLMLGCAALRMMGIAYGLPGTYFPDEPHHINIALYFSSGDLNPHVFKYPTLWMYTLALSYGVVFFFWSGFGLLHTPAQFAELFVWDPSLIYLTSRVVAALFAVFTLIWIYNIGKKASNAAVGLIGAALLAVSPPLLLYGFQAKADMLLIFFLAPTWLFALRYYSHGHVKDALLCGTFFGLSVSTQYTALLIGPILFWAHAVRQYKNGAPLPACLYSHTILFGYLFSLLAFFIGTPFSLLDFQTFKSDFLDVVAYRDGVMAENSIKFGVRIFEYFSRAGGPYGIGALLLFGGIAHLYKKDKMKLAFFLGPIGFVGLALATQDTLAVVPNYSFGAYPGLVVLMALSWHWVAGFSKKNGTRVFLAALMVAPSTFASVKYRSAFTSSDTRTEAKYWIEKNIPAGATLLMDQIHVSPPLVMDKDQLENLYLKTKEARHPRHVLYKKMLDTHPGDGYKIIRVQYTFNELISMKRHTEWSQKGYDLLNVENGLEEAVRAGVDYIVFVEANWALENRKRLKKYHNELLTTRVPIKEFIPKNPTSPPIKIFKIST